MEVSAIVYMYIMAVCLGLSGAVRSRAVSTITVHRYTLGYTSL